MAKDPFSAASKKTKKVEPDENEQPAVEAAEGKNVDATDEKVETVEDVKVEKEGKGAAVTKEKTKQASIKTMFKATAKKNGKKAAKEDEEEENGDESESEEIEEAVDSGKCKYDREEFKPASNGKEYNFKIASWNINGVRAWIEVNICPLVSISTNLRFYQLFALKARGARLHQGRESRHIRLPGN